MNALFEIKRFAAPCLHFGQSVIGFAVIFCSASHSWWQAVHWYS